MARRMFVASGTAVVLAWAAACAQGTTPIAPSTSMASTEAAADGSTLKVNAPGLTSPIGGIRLDTLEPEFTIQATTARFTATPDLEYRIYLETATGQFVMNSPKLAPGTGPIKWEIPVNLNLDTRYRWRARAEMGSKFGPWSGYQEFITLDYKGIVPRPPDGKWPDNGEDLVEYIMQVFPEYLVTTEHLPERIANMEFLRDRIIEAGICGGLILGHNRKRGNGPHSTDAIAWRDGGEDEVVDIASAFDDENIPLVLHWAIVEGPPGFDPYPNHPGC